MAANPFVDYVKIYFKSGSGGAGATAFRREKYINKGGPEGGDGGKGGDIILLGDTQLWTLLDLKYRKHIRAEHGERGGGSKKKGKDGKSETLRVPLGTVVKDAETEEIIGEITKNGETMHLIQGGKGGLGNWHFRSSTNQAPRYSQSGIAGEEREIILELKVLADVGLVGFPNAGKSTLLAALTAAKPAIADYPFTTLVPNLGIVRYRDYKSFVMADIPGIIEGAHKGKGLGTRFLRHIERNPVLLFLIPGDSEDILKELNILRNELKEYDPELTQKTYAVGISKSDLIQESIDKYMAKHFKNIPHVVFSAVTGDKIPELKDMLWELMEKDLEKE